MPAQAAELASLRSELESERRKRTDLEFEITGLSANDETRHGPPPPATATVKNCVVGSNSSNQSSSAKAARQLRRVEAHPAKHKKAAEAERDRLRTRVAELEAKSKEPVKNDDQEMELIRLRRKVEQLEADLRRIRGGKPAEPAPAPAPTGDALIAELEEKVRRLISERDEALQKPARQSSSQRQPHHRPIPKIAESWKKPSVGSINWNRNFVASPSDKSPTPSARPSSGPSWNRRCASFAMLKKNATACASWWRDRREADDRPATLDGIQTVSDGLADIRAALRAAATMWRLNNWNSSARRCVRCVARARVDDVANRRHDGFICCDRAFQVRRAES